MAIVAWQMARFKKAREAFWEAVQKEGLTTEQLDRIKPFFTRAILAAFEDTIDGVQETMRQGRGIVGPLVDRYIERTSELLEALKTPPKKDN